MSTLRDQWLNGEDVIYDPYTHVSPASLAPDYAERIITVFSFSKSHAMSGLRTGYIVTSSPVLKDRIPKLLRCTINGVNSLAQWAALAAVTGDQSQLAQMRAEYLVRRDALGENLPTADLCLTAWHPVYVDGFLVNVGDLVNGTSILVKAADGQDSLDFFNIELERHDILNAQGAFCESLYRAGTGTERCAPHLRLYGGRGKLSSYMRSAASVVIDRRQPIDVIRDNLEERGLGLARAAPAPCNSRAAR